MSDEKEVSSSTNERFAYSVAEVSSLTTLSQAYIRDRIREGKLEAVRFGRRVLITSDALQRFIESGVREG